MNKYYNEIAPLMCPPKTVPLRNRGYAILNKCGLYRILYPVAKLDAFLSRFKVSCSLGTYLVCKGIK